MELTYSYTSLCVSWSRNGASLFHIFVQRNRNTCPAQKAGGRWEKTIAWSFRGSLHHSLLSPTQGFLFWYTSTPNAPTQARPHVRTWLQQVLSFSGHTEMIWIPNLSPQAGGVDNLGVFWALGFHQGSMQVILKLEGNWKDNVFFKLYYFYQKSYLINVPVVYDYDYYFKLR